MKHIYTGEVCMFIERVIVPVAFRPLNAPMPQFSTCIEYLNAVVGKRIPVKVGETVLGVVHSFKIKDNRVIGTYDAYEGGDAKE